MSGPIDLRSDVVTRPTEAMRRAMAAADVGDDGAGEDPTVNRLEDLAAAKTGKAAALYCPSGTMANHVALFTHTQRGDEVIVESFSHMYFSEVGGMATLAGLQARCVPGRQGILDPEDVRRAIRPENIHFPRTGLICVENTHNRASGVCTPLPVMQALARVAHDAGIPLHVDGARVFNAAVALGLTVDKLVADADSVQFCVSKGLGAPVGSLLAGSREFIGKARKVRKLLGGTMRQAGVIAAAGIIALETMVDRLAEDHANARRLAEGLAALPGITVDLTAVQTNIVIFNTVGTGKAAAAIVAEVAKSGVLIGASTPESIRAVTHKDVSAADIETALQAIARAVRS